MAAPPEGDVMTGQITTILATFGGVALVLAGSENETPSYVWNGSGSVPIGLYRLQPVERLSVTDLVAIRPPEPLATFLDFNGYLPIGAPMLKRILALPGQTVCRTRLTITVDDIEVGHARERDGRGRPLPAWQAAAFFRPAKSLS
jgi:type IV secretory pathway protease TraF